MSSHLSNTTTDHEEIRRWAESRGARPARVRGTGNSGDPGIIRLDLSATGERATSRDSNGEVHHHTRPYMREHEGERE